MVRRLPRRSRNSRSGSVSRSMPLKRTVPETCAGLLRQQAHNGERGDALAATGFADDAERCATREIESTVSTACVTAPAVAVERDLQVGDFDKRGRGHWSPAAASVRAISCSIKPRSVMPTGSRRFGRTAPERHPALPAYAFKPLEFGERFGVIVNAQVEIGPVFLAINQQRGRLLAALVAAGGFARPHRRDQPARKRQGRIGEIGCRGVVEYARPRKHVAGDGKPVAMDMAVPLNAGRPGMGGDAAACVDDMELTMVAPGIGGDQCLDNDAPACPRAASAIRCCRKMD